MVSFTHAKDLGRLLRQARRQRQLTAAELGDKVGLSQSKISKLENGYPPFDVELLQKILDILDPPQTLRQQFSLLCMQQGIQTQAFHSPYRAFVQTAIRYEEAARSIRIFTMNAVPAITQTVAYRRQLLTSIGCQPDTLDSIMKSLDKRQDRLWDSNRSFQILIYESALYTVFTPLAVHLAQLDRLDRLTVNDNIKFGIIPFRAGLSVHPLMNFIIFDDERLIAEIGEIEEDITDRMAITHYEELYTALQSKALFEAEASQLVRQAMVYYRSAVDEPSGLG